MTFRVFERPAPRRSLATFLALPIDGEPLLWDATNFGDDEAFAGRGVARGVETPLASAAARTAELFADLDGSIRALAAFPFDDHAPAGPYAGFGAGLAVVPRLAYVHRGDASFLRLIAPTGTDADAELAPIAAALERATAPTTTPREVRVEDLSSAAWTELVTAGLRAIARGALAKIVLARRAMLAADEPFDVAAILERLAIEPAARFALGHHGSVFLGASPERLVSLRAGRIAIDALAGTAPIGVDPARLLGDDKERREHAAVIAGIAAALGATATLDPPGEPVVHPLRHVQHLRTPLTATPRAGASIFDLLAALHPTPAVGGLPRAEALAFLREHEPAPRGLYAGPIGCFDAAGEGTFAVAIRSALVSGKGAIVHTGAGIVAGSDPAREYEETRVKQRVAFDALGART